MHNQLCDGKQLKTLTYNNLKSFYMKLTRDNDNVFNKNLRPVNPVNFPITYIIKSLNIKPPL